MTHLPWHISGENYSDLPGQETEGLIWYVSTKKISCCLIATCILARPQMARGFTGLASSVDMFSFGLM